MKRRWFHFHFVTLLATVAVAAGLAGIVATGPDAFIFQWPLAPGTATQTLQTNIFDIVLAVLLTAGTATFFELWLRQRHLFRVRLQTIFGSSD